MSAIWSNNPTANFNAPALSWPKYQTLARDARAFSSMGVSAFDNFTLTGNGEDPDQLNGLRVSGAFFSTLGILPARGRDFTAADDVPNGPNGVHPQPRAVDDAVRPSVRRSSARSFS